MRTIALILAFASLSGCDCCLVSAMADETSPLIVIPTKPVPEIDDTPKPVTTLADDELYVIESSVPLIVLASPVGIVSIDATDGPMRIRGKFAGGSGNETRKFAGPHLYLIEATKAGTVELLIVPVGVSTESDILRQSLTVGKQSPRPPPDPQPEPQPEPTTGKLWITVVEDAQNRSLQTAICLNALVGWNELADRGHSWRIYDDQSTEPKGKEALEAAAEAGQALPAMIVSDAESGKVLRVLPLPETIDGVKRVVAELSNQ